MSSTATTPQADTHNEKAQVFTVGTRKSPLALKQTELVIQTAQASFPSHAFETRAKDNAAGDIDKVTAFKDMNVKNIWTHELETLMIEKQLDILVHSLKGIRTSLLCDHDNILTTFETFQHSCLPIARSVVP